MNNGICSFGEEFEREITTCKNEEDTIKKKLDMLEEERKMILSQLHSDWEVRINKLKEIRLNKIKEIDDEYEKCNLELGNLEKEANNILRNYCYKRKNHSYILIQSKNGGLTGENTFAGSVHTFRHIYKCSVCGEIYHLSGKSAGYARIHEYKQVIPEDAYDDESLSDNGRTYRMIKEEIDELKIYMDYLILLKGKICELFGHEATADAHEYFTCKCCGKLLRHDEYINDYYNARYRGVVDYYYDSYPGKNYYVISQNGELDFSLSTYESCRENIIARNKQLVEQEAKKKKRSFLGERPTW